MPTANERIAWLTSARDQAAVDLLRDILQAQIRLALIVCATESGPYVEPVRRLSADSRVPYLHFRPPRIDPDADPIGAARPYIDDDLWKEVVTKYRRRKHDEYLWRELAGYDCPTVVLVGYMRIVTSVLSSRVRTILNLHPAPPFGPKGQWQEVIWTLISTRARLAGGMLHIATEELDRGPVVSHYTIPIDDGELAPLWSKFADKLRTKSLQQIAKDEGEREPLFSAIRKRQFVREAPLLITTLRRLLDGTLQIVDPTKGGVRFGGLVLSDGACLTDEVEAALREQRG